MSPDRLKADTTYKSKPLQSVDCGGFFAFMHRMATPIPRPLMWIIGLLIVLVLLPMVAMSIAVAAIAWMPLSAALGVVAIWMLVRWHQTTSPTDAPR
jgi:hypothetical protein